MGKNERGDDDVMVLAVSVGLDRGMEGQRDGGEDEIFMRSSCWGEAGLQSMKQQQPANRSLTSSQRPDKVTFRKKN